MLNAIFGSHRTSGRVDPNVALTSRVKALALAVWDSFNPIAMRYDRAMRTDPIHFRFDERKGVEVLTYVAERWPGITPFYASKVLFVADEEHINAYGRPITGDTFIAMPNGPVPSATYALIKGQLDAFGAPEAIFEAIEIRQGPRYKQIFARRSANREKLSPSDEECLDNAIAFCRGRDFDELSMLTHQNPAYQRAMPNGPMDPADMVRIDLPHRDEVLQEMRDFSRYGLL